MEEGRADRLRPLLVEIDGFLMGESKALETTAAADVSASPTLSLAATTWTRPGH